MTHEWLQMHSSVFSFSLKAHANRRNKSHCCVLLEAVLANNVASVSFVCGPKSLTGFRLYATSANKCQHCCGFVQTDATCWAQQCCVLLANNVAAYVCMGLTPVITREHSTIPEQQKRSQDGRRTSNVEFTSMRKWEPAAGATQPPALMVPIIVRQG